MKTRTIPFAALAALLLLNGCQAPAPTTRGSQPVPRDAEIARILELKARGVISDAQAVQIIGAMVAEGAAPAASSPVPAAPAAPAAVAAIPAPAPSPVPAPAPVAATEAGPALDPRYRPQVVLTGRLRSIGSDTMDLLVANWEAVFTKYHPGLKVVHEGRGSSTATPSSISSFRERKRRSGLKYWSMR